MGQSADFEKLLVEQINCYGRWYCCLAYRILQDMAAAEDVCQTAFLTAWEQRDRIRDTQALRSWLSSVVVNQSLLLCRRRKLERRHLGLCQRETMVQMDECEAFEFRDSFAHALAELPEKTQVVVVLRLVEQWSGNEVKKLMDCSASEISRRLHTGMEHLRRRLTAAHMAEKQVGSS